MGMRDNEPILEGPLGLPDGDGFDAVLEAEELRAQRHGGLHGLVLIEVDLGPGDGEQAETVAVALMESLRQTDLLARIDHRTFGVLALHCHDLESVLSRLWKSLETVGFRLVASVRGRSGSTQLRATWTALVSGLDPAPAPARSAARYAPFVALLPPSLN